MTMCSYCRETEATHDYKGDRVCLEHYKVFTEADELEQDYARAILPAMKAWVSKKAKEGLEANRLEAAIHGYVSGADSPFTLGRIRGLIEEAMS
jgi:hypothetical protein